MDISSIIQIILIIGLGAFVYYSQNKKTEENQDQQREQMLQNEIAELKAEIQMEKSEKDKLSGQGKQLFAEITTIKAEKKSLQEKHDELKDLLAKHNAEKKRMEADFENRLNKLEEAKNSLEDERKRIRREDEERQERLMAERDRIWAEHETEVLSLLNSICKTPEFSFKTYDNNNLPDDFTGKLKPDFMLEFLEQYVIFDAKTTKSDNLNTYISDQVKKTAAKLEANPKIHNAIYFVVPVDAIHQLKKHHFYEDGFNFYVITPEAIAPILASFKKIESYEFAEQMNPQDRENITALIAELDQHINFSNAAHLLLTQRGINSLEKLKGLTPELIEEIEIKKDKMRLQSFKPTDIKQFMMGTHTQQQAVREHISPKAQVKNSEIEQVQKLLEE